MTKNNQIWIVDDDKLYRILLTKTIHKVCPNVDIQTYCNGEEAIEALKSNSDLPDIILLDLNMPIMDGWEFMKEYNEIKKGWTKKITIYAVSSSISTADVEKSKTFEDISEYIIKPLKNEKITAILNCT